MTTPVYSAKHNESFANTENSEVQVDVWPPLQPRGASSSAQQSYTSFAVREDSLIPQEGELLE